ncbi:riboflavin synthase [Halovenus sp. WSH3]|uniref:Riboflavin synthase n=1 Tax=Halovenus carboxidivorans TaxID=2692199 RepID=A0A6B0SZ40_9EURY|nr:riboflavin synthase [Halovenus carboxidivorans]MXR50894.1 riboflavin synthase [Halovenus carboxidivorans]
MFTGIVEETGKVRRVEESPEGKRLRLSTTFEDLSVGQSISVSGACLTVEEFGDDYFEVFTATETLEKTYLGELEVGDVVNLERALPAEGRFDGHFVQGHVDATATVTGIERLGDDWEFSFELPADLAPYVVDKGSITVDGISLTVAAQDGEEFAVAIIPETYDITTLSEKSVGDPVHLEVDVIAKYVESLVDGYTG